MRLILNTLKHLLTAEVLLIRCQEEQIAGVDMDRLYKECKYYAPTKYNDYGWYRKFEKRRF